MAEPPRKSWTWDAYLAWEDKQPIRYELVDGQVFAMGGGTLAHDVIANNLQRTLATGTGNARYPDALIDRGRFVPTALQAREPTVVFEALLRSTAWIDQTLKLRDYDATQTIRHYVIISRDEPRTIVYTRGDDGRLDLHGAVLLTGLHETVDLPGAGIALPLAELYEGMAFDLADPAIPETDPRPKS
jgi:Uma2 family endonuclease